MKNEETFFEGKQKENKGIKNEKRRNKGKQGKTLKENEKMKNRQEKKDGPMVYFSRRPKK